MLEITRTDVEATRRIVLRGELDLETSTRLLVEIQGAVKERRNVAVELSAVEYVDSSGIAVLIQGVRLALRAKLKLSLAKPSPRVMSVIELSQLRDFFTIEEA